MMPSEPTLKLPAVRHAFAEGLLQDVSYSLRSLARSPGFTIVTLLTLALGIGANSAMFSVVHGVVLATLPYPDANRLVFLWQTRAGVSQLDPSEPNFEDWQRSSRSFEQMSAVVFHNFNLSAPGLASHLLGIRGSAAFLATLKVAPALGRDLNSTDDQPNASPVALISDRVWKERLGGSRERSEARWFSMAERIPSSACFLHDFDSLKTRMSSRPCTRRCPQSMQTDPSTPSQWSRALGPA
jgi:hypothetical protein